MDERSSFLFPRSLTIKRYFRAETEVFDMAMGLSKLTISFPDKYHHIIICLCNQSPQGLKQ
ncbi:hypothetical protein H5410_063318 [Solanum commersonii]|uniref:Uncharacterized protein n=1 Tax=Solanum commersonii TaxID=4109 RepID=A0A9J5WEX9_SOLCO|nr:hypothetical protein H5410_063318 [Solanum commersonii]